MSREFVGEVGFDIGFDPVVADVLFFSAVPPGKLCFAEQRIIGGFL